MAQTLSFSNPTAVIRRGGRSSGPRDKGTAGTQMTISGVRNNLTGKRKKTGERINPDQPFKNKSLNIVSKVNPDIMPKLRQVMNSYGRNVGWNLKTYSELDVNMPRDMGGELEAEDLLQESNVRYMPSMHSHAVQLALPHASSVYGGGSATARNGRMYGRSAPAGGFMGSREFAVYSTLTQQLLMSLGILTKNLNYNTTQEIIANNINKSRLVLELHKQRPQGQKKNSNCSAGALIHNQTNNHRDVQNYLPPVKYLKSKKEWKAFTRIIAHDTFKSMIALDELTVEDVLITTTGTQSFQVVGNHFQIREIDFKYAINYQTLVNDDDSVSIGAIPFSTRFALVWDHNPTGEIPDYENIFEDITIENNQPRQLTSFQASVNDNNFKRFQILFDIVVNTEGGQFNSNTRSAGGYPGNTTGSYRIDFDALNLENRISRVRDPLITRFQTNATSVNLSTITTGALYFVAIPDNVAELTEVVVSTADLLMPSWICNFKVYFT